MTFGICLLNLLTNNKVTAKNIAVTFYYNLNLQ